MPKNYGYVYEPIDPEVHYVFGGYTNLGGEVLQPDGDWSAYLPTDELQSPYGFETEACTVFTTLNAAEILIRRKFGEERNYSDRFLATLAGTTKDGNSPHTVAETLRLQGDVLENVWPYGPDINTWEKYYAPLPQALKSLATTFIEEWKFGHEWVITDPDRLVDALKYSPLGVSLYAWAINPATGLYYRPQGAPDVHFCIVYKTNYGQKWFVYDTYDNTRKELQWDFNFGQAKRYSIEKQVFTPSFWDKFIALIKSIFNTPMPTPTVPPTIPSPAEPQPVKPTLDQLCNAIKEHEGWFAGSRSYKNNNPGNCRYSSQGYRAIYQPVLRDKDNFAVFKDYKTGWLYLQNLLKEKIASHPNWTLYDLFKEYAPSTDGNDPKQYAEIVAQKIAVAPTYLLKDISA